jgi:L-alanine-DL-glutamate epimerase-like enolase superfamily enzyme
VVKLITNNGVIGWGESAPLKIVTGETAETIIRALSKIAPKIIGMSPLRIEQIVETMDSTIKGNPSAKAAVDVALHDVLGKIAGKPLFMLIGGFRTAVLTDITLSIKSAKEMASDAANAVKRGFRAVKVKVGTDPREDVEHVKTIREAIGRNVRLRIDANQGWTTKQAIDALNKMEKFNIQFVEQPVPAEDLKGLSKVRRDSPILVMADESVHSPEDAMRAIQAEAVDLINIKLMKCGGILKGRKIAEIAESAGVPCMIGCMGESALSIAAGSHLAAGIKNIQYADLDSDLFFKDKLVKRGGTKLKDSMRTFTEANGLGLEELDERLLGRPLMVFK